MFKPMSRLSPRRGRITAFFILPVLLACPRLPAYAGSIFFDLALSEDQLTLTNRGDSSAYYTAAARLLSSGEWVPISPAAGETPSAQLEPASGINFKWGAEASTEASYAVAELGPILLSFYDQAGGRFEQITFLHPPPLTSDAPRIDYKDGVMTLHAPNEFNNTAMKESWLLWTQSEGLEKRTGDLNFNHKQKHAKKIHWSSGMKMELKVGKGVTEVIALNEKNGSYIMQKLEVTPEGKRLIGIDARNIFWATGAGLLIASAALFLFNGRPAGRETINS
jgi:hypothetical protein